jgi:hypothetical protein
MIHHKNGTVLLYHILIEMIGKMERKEIDFLCPKGCGGKEGVGFLGKRGKLNYVNKMHEHEYDNLFAVDRC